MNYLTVKEVSDKWQISTRRVCFLCNQGKIPGAVKKSKVWMIPDNIQKPEDARKRNVNFDGVSNLYPMILLLNPTYFEYNPSTLPSKEEQALCEIQDLFLKGDVDKAYGDLCNLMRQSNSHYCLMMNVLRLIYSADTGDKEGYYQSRKNIDYYLNLEEYALEKKLFSFYMKSIINNPSYTLENDFMYADMMPLISFICVRKSINNAFKTAACIECSVLEIICKELEMKDSPLILAYLHIFMAVYYNTVGVKELYNIHITKAVSILLPRKWYLPIAEYSSTLDLKFIEAIDAQTYNTICSLSKKITGNYVKMGIFKDFQTAPHMDHTVNVQICYKLAQGKNNEEIADELGISQYKVRKHLDELIACTGSKNKKDLKEIFMSNLFV